LDYEGEHYAFSLMTPEFSPPKSGLGPIPVSIAAVGPALLRLAGEVCDGVRLHVFATRKFVEEIALPEIRSGLNKAGRNRSNFEVWGGGFIVTGKDEAALVKEREEVRYRIAFYGSTRSYHPVLALHGWEDLGLKLHEMSKKGQWKQMAAQVSDEVLEEFAVIATYDNLVSKLTERFGGQTDCITLPMPQGIPDDEARGLIQDIKRINSPFKSFPTSW
jgi:probable F420-dependent oxidoreductase